MLHEQQHMNRGSSREYTMFAPAKLLWSLAARMALTRVSQGKLKESRYTGGIAFHLIFVPWAMIVICVCILNGTPCISTSTHLCPAIKFSDRVCGLMVRVPGYSSRDPGFYSGRYQIFWEVVGLEQGPLSLLRITEELLQWKSSCSGPRKSRLTAVGIHCAYHATSLTRKSWH
jgi:hypothetical protein